MRQFSVRDLFHNIFGLLLAVEEDELVMRINTKMEQLLASQQKVQELTTENEQQKRDFEQQKQDFDQQKQDFEGRIAQLQQEKEEVLKELGKKLAEEEDEQSMQPLHEMKVQLPLENWFDLLALVPRQQLGNIASQIGDFQFACILQSFLRDERREITLGRMKIIPPRYNVPSDRPMLQGHHYEFPAKDLPDWPMPQNVKNFEEISLNFNHVDMPEPVVDFLRKFQENSLLENVNMYLYAAEYYNHVPILNKMVPLISSIDSIDFCQLNLFDWVYNNDNDEESQQLLKTMVAQTRILAIGWDTYESNCTWECKFIWCCSWLYSPRDDGMPRTLIAEDNLEATHYSSLIDRIKKDFEEASQAVSFFIRLIRPRNFQQEISLNNDKTNENLVVKAVYERNIWFLLISRHSSKVAKPKIEKDEKEISEWNTYSGTKHICLRMRE